jgi:LysM repeat protein
VRSYCADHAPPDTVLAASNVKHTIQPGETLPAIAQRYQVNVQLLRRFNDVSGDVLEAGRVLRIPKLTDGGVR